MKQGFICSRTSSSVLHGYICTKHDFWDVFLIWKMYWNMYQNTCFSRKYVFWPKIRVWKRTIFHYMNNDIFYVIQNIRLISFYCDYFYCFTYCKITIHILRKKKNNKLFKILSGSKRQTFGSMSKQRILF